MSDEVQKTKTELISEMKELQQSYSKLAAVLKAMTAEEEAKQTEARQLERLEQYKAKYKFYAQADGSVKDIDWEEVEKLIKTSFGKQLGYALGFDQTGMEGLGYDYGNGGVFAPMVEDETEAQRCIAREKRRQEFIANSKQQR
jgi:predicted nuclease with TOPRIM domain